MSNGQGTIAMSDVEENLIKKLTLGFIKTPMEETFSFEVEEGYALKTVHRMRVELSRQRNIVKKAKKKLKQFKMLVEKVELLQKKDGDLVALEKVTLLKTQTGRQKIIEALPELMADDNG